jgi:ketosteroid isomerase-like protein
MAGEREAKLRAIWARYKATGDPRLDENFDPEIEWHLRADLPDSRTLHGLQQVEQLFAEWSEAFEDLQIDPVEISEVAGRTIAVLRLRGRVKGSAQAVEMDEVWVYRWRDEKAIEIREYATKDEALRSLGVSVEP